MAAQIEANFAVKTRILVVSDTHGQNISTADLNHQAIDVAVHCGDLTEHSKLAEFRTTLDLLRQLDAPLKLVIAGNHDFTLDSPVFQRKLAEAERIAGQPLGSDVVDRDFGRPGEPLRLLQQAQRDGIVFLHEGTHSFVLGNGARLKVYASPYTPAAPSPGGDDGWAFQYAGSHRFDIESDTDLVMTHGPPRGIMDVTAEKKRIGCVDLFAAVARAQPKVHCFGHVHDGWGAKLVAWRRQLSDAPSHFCAIDNGRSHLFASLASLRAAAAAVDRQNQEPCASYFTASHDEGEGRNDAAAGQRRTLMVNAAVMADDGPSQRPWIVNVELARAEGVVDA